MGLHLSSSLKAYSLYNIIIYSDSRGAFIHEIRLKRFHYCIELKQGNCISLYIIENAITITIKGIFQNEGHKRERLTQILYGYKYIFLKKKTEYM